ncbi:hypothetical protein [Ornithinibacillus californiensis]|uniref:hypothetical protein n=1 Tax=Ornithinibacillus californiensis TaxID=161536 RepID=UPI00064DAD19|nr:hypothetical protein [Ornithinibacillus californiensis]
MDLIKLEWVPLHKIKARHTTTKSLTRYSYHRYTNNHVPYIHIIRDKKGQLLLHKGIEAYNILKSQSPQITVPVYILEKQHITQLDWTLRLFQSCMQEKVNYKLKYEYIMLLLKETNNNIKRICENTGCSKNEIYQLIFDPTIPEKYKELAMKYNRRCIVNEIAKNPKLLNYRSVLYPAVFQKKNRLTYEKLKLFLTFLDAGYDFNVNSILALQNLNQVVDRDQALRYYWDHLTFPHTQIMEGVFYYKGDKNSKINVRL